MPFNQGSDYFFLPQAVLTGQTPGCFLATQSHFYFSPNQDVVHSGRKITTTTYSYGDKTPQVAITEQLNDPNMTSDKIHAYLSAKVASHKVRVIPFSELKRFAVKIGWLSKDIIIQVKGDFPDTVHVKDKELLTSFKQFSQSLNINPS
jgi:hypothetical protein